MSLGAKPVTTGVLRPTDVLIAGYNAVMAGVWLSLSEAADHALGLGLAHAAGAFLPVLLGRARAARMPLPLRAVRESYPLLLLGVFWIELGLLFQLRQPAVRDGLVAEVDLAWFGQHLNLTWMPAMPSLWFSELMHFLYFSYYVAAFLPPLYLVAFGTRPAASDGLFRLLSTYLSCFLWYLVFPVVGPAEFMPLYDGPLTEGLFYKLTHGARAAGDSLGTAFPSSHVAGVMTATVIAWRWLPRPVAWVLIVDGVGVMCAAVYTQNHYAIDVVAGLVWVLVLQIGVIPLLTRQYGAWALRR